MTTNKQISKSKLKSMIFSGLMVFGFMGINNAFSAESVSKIFNYYDQHIDEMFDLSKELTEILNTQINDKTLHDFLLSCCENITNINYYYACDPDQQRQEFSKMREATQDLFDKAFKQELNIDYQVCDFGSILFLKNINTTSFKMNDVKEPNLVCINITAFANNLQIGFDSKGNDDSTFRYIEFKVTKQLDGTYKFEKTYDAK